MDVKEINQEYERKDGIYHKYGAVGIAAGLIIAGSSAIYCIGGLFDNPHKNKPIINEYFELVEQKSKLENLRKTHFPNYKIDTTKFDSSVSTDLQVAFKDDAKERQESLETAIAKIDTKMNECREHKDFETFDAHSSKIYKTAGTGFMSGLCVTAFAALASIGLQIKNYYDKESKIKDVQKLILS